MSRLKSSWQAVESVPGLAAVGAEWQSLLGDEFDLFKPFLQPLQIRAQSFPRPDGGLPYDVVEHGPDDYVGVCPETGDVIALTRNQLVVYELDRRRLASRLVKALAIDTDGGPEEWNGTTVRLGKFTGEAQVCYSAFLAFPHESEDLHVVAAQLIAEKLAPFILFAASRRWLRRATETILRSHGCVFIALADAVAIPRPGHLELVQALEPIIVQATGVVSIRTTDSVAGRDARPQATYRGKAPHGHKLQFEPGAFVYKKARVELSGKPLLVLEAFAKATGNALTISDLQSKCWENSLSGEEAIRSAVSDARAALRKAIKRAKVRCTSIFDPIVNVDRGPNRTAWRLQLP